MSKRYRQAMPPRRFSGSSTMRGDLCVTPNFQALRIRHACLGLPEGHDEVEAIDRPCFCPKDGHERCEIYVDQGALKMDLFQLPCISGLMPEDAQGIDFIQRILDVIASRGKEITADGLLATAEELAIELTIDQTTTLWDRVAKYMHEHPLLVFTAPEDPVTARMDRVAAIKEGFAFRDPVAEQLQFLIEEQEQLPSATDPAIELSGPMDPMEYEGELYPQD